MKYHDSNQHGQTLVSLLVFSVMAIAAASAATAVIINSAQATAIIKSHDELVVAAESGVENALLALIRNPAYSGEVITIGSIQTVVTVTGSTTKLIESTATEGNYRATTQATVEYIDNRLTVTSWNTVY